MSIIVLGITSNTVSTTDFIQAGCAIAALILALVLAIRDATQKKEIKELNGLVDAQRGQMAELIVHSTIMRESNELMRGHNELIGGSLNLSAEQEKKKHELEVLKLKHDNKPFFTRSGGGYNNAEGRMDLNFKNVGKKAKFLGLENIVSTGIHIGGPASGIYINHDYSIVISGGRQVHGVMVGEADIHFDLVFEDTLGTKYKQSFARVNNQSSLSDPIEA